MVSETLDTYLHLTDPKRSYIIPELENLKQETALCLHALRVEDEPPICLGRSTSKVRLRYKPLEELIANTTDSELKKLNKKLVAILKGDLMYGASKYKTKKKRLEVYDRGFAALVELNHPYVLITKGKVSVLTESQYQALNNDSPTCNCCSQLMTKATGRFGDFFFCANRCAGQKTVGAAYWEKVRKKH